MQQEMKRNPASLSIASIFISVSLVAAVSWLAGPGLSDVNAFNERIFGRYYTAGAILMIGSYGLAFSAVVGGALTAAAIGWLRKERPRWITWIALLAAIVAPVVVVNLLKGA